MGADPNESEPLSADIVEKVRRSFGSQSLMRTFDARIAEIGRGFCQIEAPIVAGARQQQGHGHAGLTFSLGDSAAGFAALTLMRPEDEVVTAEIKINLLAPARGELLIAKGWVLRPGRRLMVVKSDVWARDREEERQVATLLGTMVPVAG